MIRAFVAVGIPEEGRRQIARIMGGLRELGLDARIPDPSSVHLTLKFLGETPDARLDEVVGALRLVSKARSAFSLKFSGLGAFPGLENPRVVWIGTERAKELLALQAEVEEALRELGFSPEERRFQPHLTLARIKSRRNLASLVEFVRREERALDADDFGVTSFELFQSTLTPQGARYRSLERFALVDLDLPAE